MPNDDKARVKELRQVLKQHGMKLLKVNGWWRLDDGGGRIDLEDMDAVEAFMRGGHYQSFTPCGSTLLRDFELPQLITGESVGEAVLAAQQRGFMTKRNLVPGHCVWDVSMLRMAKPGEREAVERQCHQGADRDHGC